MSGLTLPLALAALAIITTFLTYRAIRRGGARFYTLEREALLRQATFMLLGTMVLFVAAVGLLTFNLRQMTAEEPAAEPDLVLEDAEATATPDVVLDQFPPTPTPTPTPDPNIPTPTPTPILRRALIDGTGGNGLYLRDAPGGETITILPDGSFVTLLDEPPVPANGFSWVRVRTTVGGEEGWVADSFLVTSENQLGP